MVDGAGLADRLRPPPHGCRWRRSTDPAGSRRCVRGQDRARPASQSPACRCERTAISRKLFFSPGTPRTCAKPSRRSRSSGDTSSMSAAISLIFFASAMAARCAEEPALTAVRAAKVPTPKAISLVSAVATVTSSVGDAELVGRDLGQRRLVRLPLRGGAGVEHHLARRGDPYGGALIGAEPGAFHGIADADADIAALPQRLRLPGREIRIAGGIERARLRGGIIAAVIGHRTAVARDDTDFVRHLRRRDEIAPAHFGAVEAGGFGEAVHQPLHHEHALRAAGAAHRRRRDHVGVDGVELDAKVWDHIRPRHRGGGDPRQHQAPRNERAGVVQEPTAQAEDLAVTIGRELHLPKLVALLVGAKKILAPVLDPFHRPSEHFCAGRDARIFRIDRALGAEAPAYIRRDHMHLVVVEVEHVEQPALDAMRPLRGNVDRVAVRDGVVARHQPAALHEERPAAVDRDALAHHMGGAGEGRVGIPDADRQPRRNV